MPNKVYVINKHGRPLMPCSRQKPVICWMPGKPK